MLVTDRGRADESPARKRWERPTLTSVGHVGKVLQGGGGKLTPSPNDPGDIRKPKGSG